MDTHRSTPQGQEPTTDTAADADDGLDDAVIAADDTGMISGERLITLAEIEEADVREGSV